MAITLTDLAINANNKLVPGFINELITDSFLLGNMTFDDCVSSNGQSNLGYDYNRVISPSSAAFRKLNTEGKKSEPKIERVTTQIAILNSTFEIDRVSAAAANALLQLRLEEAKNAIIRKYSGTIVNGDTNVDADGFNGLDTILKDTDTEVTSQVDISDAQAMTDNAMAFADEMDEFLSKLDGDPSCLLVGRVMSNKFAGIGRRLGKYQITTNDAGRRIATWDGIPIEYLKDGAITTQDVYAVRLGMDGFHGITLAGGNAITVNAPQLDTPGAVKIGDAEFVVGCALKKTKAAGVLRSKMSASTEG